MSVDFVPADDLAGELRATTKLEQFESRAVKELG